MATVFDKLQLKARRELVVIGAPDTFEVELASVDASVLRDPLPIPPFDFALAFASRQAELDRLIPPLAAAARGDALLWFAYPKGSSKRYRCDFNRDTGWDGLRALGWDSVRQIAIDADWTALRFRRNDFIG